MAILKSASKISSRPQIKAVKQPIPRQVILPKKAKPVKAPARPLIAPPLPSLPRQLTSASVGDIKQSDTQSILNRLQQLQNNFNNTNQGTNVSPAQPAPAMADFNSYGFDRGLVDYLNNQQRMSATDAGISYSYDPATQTFTGGTMGGPVTMTLAQMQAQAQNYQNRPVYNPRVNPSPIVGQSSVGSIGYPAGGGTTNYQGQQLNPATSTIGGFGQPQNPYNDNGMQLPAGYNVGTAPAAPVYDPNRGSLVNDMRDGGGGVLPQPPTNFYQGGPRGGLNPYTTDYTRPAGSDIAGFSAFNPMFNPMVNPMYNAPMPNNMNQQGFVPMGGNNPQNTSYGSFGAIEQPMGGFGNIGSLLGMG